MPLDIPTTATPGTLDERSSSRASGTTYHSFNDSELYEPSSPPRPPVTYDSRSLQQLEMLQMELQRQREEAAIAREREWQRSLEQERRPSTSSKMQRQDSGYESIAPPRRASTSNTRPIPPRRSSNASSNGASGSGSSSSAVARRSRPSFRRAAKSHPHNTVTAARNSNQSLHLGRNSTSNAPTTLVQFPSPDPVRLSVENHVVPPTKAPQPIPTPPPQTTHYWTSDRTRRLEYAAIDAATRGVKGWILRHLVPDCFIPKDSKRITFDDDSGSVRRYRLELEDERDHIEKANFGSNDIRRRRGWRFWRRRRYGFDSDHQRQHVATY